MGTILISGASGFIGARLLATLHAAGEEALAMVRAPTALPAAVAVRQADLRDPQALQRACQGVDTVFHCAGHAHAFGAAGASTDVHHEINFVGTRNLVEAAAQAGVRRFVFLSSVKAMGDPGDACADENWHVPPETPYGVAKRGAEGCVRDCAARVGMHAVNLRLAMVYGPGSRGNLERMVRGIRAGWFPPLPETQARRSLVHVDDVVAAALAVARDPRAAGKTYIVASPQAYSGAQLYDTIRQRLGMPAARLRCPATCLRAVGWLGDGLQALVRRPMPINRQIVSRLLDAECYSPALIRQELGWQARVGLAEGLAVAPAAGVGEAA